MKKRETLIEFSQNPGRIWSQRIGMSFENDMFKILASIVHVEVFEYANFGSFDINLHDVDYFIAKMSKKQKSIECGH